jgi:hypothetical protein
MRYAVLQNNVVANIVVSDEPLGESWLADPICNIGDVWDGEKFVTPGPTEEDVQNKWAETRKRRDGLLSLCDWTQVADAPVDDLQWAVYRQALRDLPQTQTDPFNIVWPEPPTT